ncbi:tRNA lysidine(34) synthetase TilS [Flammeovirgaceae bacterium SG7u.111]|nr:tRNA lysidine(34) synthetase TilS [Flammeovirgaceae bacterium SG7u.132]WPO37015.1 tRNA lysidine(34) synthetase TilS [Flammeovirgaceae bacterium SG7u.111]
MITLFKRFIQKENLVGRNEKILLAVSGGIDSMVMLDLFEKSGHDFGIAHMNFGLRGEVSDEDELFVQTVSQRCRKVFFTKKVATESYAKEKGISTQMAARELRYAWFDGLMEQEGYDLLATAHHLNDSVETVLLNLGRGTGIAGMKGILPQKGKTIRPLLFATRMQIEGYAKENNITWREDASNASIKYDRNLVRHKVVPVMRQLNPSFEQVMGENIEKLRGVESLFGEYVELLREKLVSTENDMENLSIELLLAQKEPKVLLYYLLKEKGFNFRQMDDVFEALESGSGKMILSQSHRLLVDREELKIEGLGQKEQGEIRISPEETACTTDGLSFSFKKVEMQKLEGIPRDPNIAALDVQKITFPLTLRTWQEGDWFVPLGMKGKKKLSDFLIDQKVDRFQKEKVKVLCSATGEVIWVVGRRISEKFKLTKSSNHILLVEVTKN